jgi:hypothetical protein
VRLHAIFWQISQAKPGKGRIEPKGYIVKHQWPFDPDLSRTPTRRALHMSEGGD